MLGGKRFKIELIQMKAGKPVRYRRNIRNAQKSIKMEWISYRSWENLNPDKFPPPSAATLDRPPPARGSSLVGKARKKTCRKLRKIVEVHKKCKNEKHVTLFIRNSDPVKFPHPPPTTNRPLLLGWTAPFPAQKRVPRPGERPWGVGVLQGTRRRRRAAANPDRCVGREGVVGGHSNEAPTKSKVAQEQMAC